MPPDGVIGWDVGGAHLKAARLDREGRVHCVMQLPCPLWRGMDQLQQAVEEIRQRLGGFECRHALTMTGELVDSFADRAEGVRRITSLMQQRLGEAGLWVYAGRQGFVAPQQAIAAPTAVASANWRASAEWAALRFGDGLLLDIGSTTTDIVPFRSHRVEALGEDDFQRLSQEELLYTGVVRTPVYALAERVPFEGEWLALMAEQFATAADVHRLTGQLPEHADQHASADGAPKTRQHSARRLARMIGRDADGAEPEQWTALAHFLAEQQLVRILHGCRRVLSRLPPGKRAVLVGAGVGRFLGEAVAQRLGYAYQAFDRTCEAPAHAARGVIADCAPAVAVAQLLRRAQPSH